MELLLASNLHTMMRWGWPLRAVVVMMKILILPKFVLFDLARGGGGNPNF
jgi:hypothetical protein